MSPLMPPSSLSSALSGSGATSGDAGPDVKPGTVASWGLQFYRDEGGDLSGTPLLIVTSDTYDGTVNATLPTDLAGGTYEAVVEGLLDGDFARLRSVTDVKLAAKLHLWWKDAPGFFGDLANFTGLTDPLGTTSPAPPEHSLVTVLRVDRMTRRAGTRRYETVFSMKERVFARLDDAHMQGLCYTSMQTAVQAVADAARITITPHGLDSSPTSTQGSDVPSWANINPGTARHALTESRNGLLDQLTTGLGLYGLSPALLRNGTLHVGRWTELNLPTRSLNSDSGLLSVQRANDRDPDARAGDSGGGSGAGGAGGATAASGAASGGAAHNSRATVTLVCLGRPDIKPGETLNAPLPPEDFPTIPSSVGSALVTSLTGFVPGMSLVSGAADDPPPTRMLVTEVRHSISRRTGFATTIKTLVLNDIADTGWDRPPDAPPAQARQARERGAVPADPAAATARALQEIMTNRSANTAAKVAQIRKHPGSDGSATTPPHHTSEVWYSTVAEAGPALAQRITISQDRHGESQEVPYLSPFAWGPYGLALPRYPGTRVMLMPGPGGTNDYVDLGAVWQRGDGPKSKAGDMWLVLPIGVTPRDDIGETDGTAPAGPASHDLIDADGVRIVETKQFVIRVVDQPTDATGRPEVGDAPNGGVLIEAKSSSSQSQILLAPDGTITVKGTSITFDTAGQGDITLKANNVKVNVSGSMDVS